MVATPELVVWRFSFDKKTQTDERKCPCANHPTDEFLFTTVLPLINLWSWAFAPPSHHIQMPIASAIAPVSESCPVPALFADFAACLFLFSFSVDFPDFTDFVIFRKSDIKKCANLPTSHFTDFPETQIIRGHSFC